MLTLLKRRETEALAPVLEGTRVCLRHPRQEDWPAWTRLRAESRRFLAPWEPTWRRDALTRAAYRRRLRRIARDRLSGEAFAFFVTAKAEGELLGGLTLSEIRRGATQSATLGYWIGERHARKGYMTDAVAAVLPFTFDRLGLHRLEAACLPDNDPSRRLLERSGFRREGLARAYVRIDGRWRDHLLFALLEDDWRSRAS